jgi:MFS family permease
VWSEAGTWTHPLGTDGVGRDYLTRMIYGARVALAVGSLSGALLGARRTRVRLRLPFLAALGFGLAMLVAALLPTYLLFVLFCPVIGFAAITVLNAANVTLQLESAEELRGRVMAIYMTIVMGGTPIGAPLIGWIGQAWGARWTLLVGGAMVIAGALLAGVVLASANRRRARVLGPRPRSSSDFAVAQASE